MYKKGLLGISGYIVTFHRDFSDTCYITFSRNKECFSLQPTQILKSTLMNTNYVKFLLFNFWVHVPYIAW